MYIAMEKVLKILVLEDLQDDVGLIERVLARQGLPFVTQRVDAREEFTSALLSFKPDVILSDHALPQFNSLEALNICRQEGIFIPFILVTGTVSEEFAVNCLKQGADDYVLKTNLVRLPSAIINSLKQREHEKKRKDAEGTLREQNQQLVKINKELDSFVYSVSHNLRAPLMSVLGLLNLVQLENEKAKTGMDSYFEMMQSSIHKLDETLKEILDYSRNARSELSVGHVDLEKLIHESFEKLRYLDGFDTIQKRIDVTAPVPLASDGYRLSVIFNNLVSNAIKYRDFQKESFVEVHAIVSDTALEFVFKDNGIGIGQEFIHRIFDMFYRATEKSEGAGLGLYIVKETIDKMSGTIKVDSKLGEGTFFHVVVPNMIKNMPEQQ
jgi:signal transduction histidine kinase